MDKIEEICKSATSEYVEDLMHGEKGLYAITKIDNITVGSFFEYIPEDRDTDGEGKAVRDLVWCFKNDGGGFKVSEYIKTLYEVEDLFANTLNTLFEGKDKSNLVLMYVPTSTKPKYRHRWRIFSKELSEFTDIANGYEYVRIDADGEASHLSGTLECKYTLDKDSLKGKDVIIIDDLIKSGHHMRQFKERLEECGANVVMGLTLAKTVED